MRPETWLFFCSFKTSLKLVNPSNRVLPYFTRTNTGELSFMYTGRTKPLWERGSVPYFTYGKPTRRYWEDYVKPPVWKPFKYPSLSSSPRDFLPGLLTTGHILLLLLPQLFSESRRVITYRGFLKIARYNGWTRSNDRTNNSPTLFFFRKEGYSDKEYIKNLFSCGYFFFLSFFYENGVKNFTLVFDIRSGV